MGAEGTPPREIISPEALVSLHAVVQHVRAMVPPDVAARLDEDAQAALADFVSALADSACAPDDAVRLFALLNFDAMARAYVRLFEQPPSIATATEVRSYVAASVDNLRGALTAIGALVLSSVRSFVEAPERLEVELLAHVERHIKILHRLLRPPLVVPNQQPDVGAHSTPNADSGPAWRAAHENVLALLSEGQFREAAGAFKAMMRKCGVIITTIEICNRIGHLQDSEFYKFCKGNASAKARRDFMAVLSLTPEGWLSTEKNKPPKH